MSASTACVTNRVASTGLLKVYGPGSSRAVAFLPAYRPHLGLDDARVSEVDRPQEGDRLAVDAGMAYVELAAGIRPGISLDHRLTCATACATVSRSVTLRLAPTIPGRLITRTAGSGRTPVLATSGRTSRSLSALTAT